MISMPLIVYQVIAQHLENSNFLWSQRSRLTVAPHIALRHLARWDERLAADLDGLAVASDEGAQMCESALQDLTPGIVFSAVVNAIENRHLQKLDRLFAVAEAAPEVARGFRSAFGWVSESDLRGIVARLLSSPDVFHREIGIVACGMHRVDPGRARDAALQDAGATLRARALRATGELGRRDLLSACVDSLKGDDLVSRFWAAWSAVLLGNRSAAIETLVDLAQQPAQFRQRATRLALQAMEQADAQGFLRQMAQSPENQRLVIQGSGIAGDPSFVPWLIQHMADGKTARVAGEAFSLITGLDLAYLDLDRKPPADIQAGPNDDPNDPNVDMDPDDGLPWPDPDRITNWWHANGSHFAPNTRYFMGAPVTRENCLRVLKEGFQRQRILAAHYLSLLHPGTPLFEWRAPVWRQRDALAGMA
jgi:uncharacterized protein (TIGR02270 family)